MKKKENANYIAIKLMALHVILLIVYSLIAILIRSLFVQITMNSNGNFSPSNQPLLKMAAYVLEIVAFYLAGKHIAKFAISKKDIRKNQVNGIVSMMQAYFVFLAYIVYSVYVANVLGTSIFDYLIPPLIGLLFYEISIEAFKNQFDINFKYKRKPYLLEDKTFKVSVYIFVTIIVLLSLNNPMYSDLQRKIKQDEKIEYKVEQVASKYQKINFGIISIFKEKNTDYYVGEKIYLGFFGKLKRIDKQLPIEE